MKMIQVKIAVYSFCSLILMSFLACEKGANLTPQMEEVFYIRNGGSDMPAWVYGNGDSKVLIITLHGGPGDYGLVNRRFTAYQELEDKYAMVYWDQRHQGNSHGHLTEEQVTADLMVEDLQLLVRTLKKRYGEDMSIFMMGHSWGGKLGTAFLIEEAYQHDINGWINIGGALDTRMEAIYVIDMVNSLGRDELNAGNNIAYWEEFIELSNSIDTTNIGIEEYLSLNSLAHGAEIYLSQLADVGDNFQDADLVSPNNPRNVRLAASQMQSFFLEEEFFQMDLIPHLSKITVPSLLIWGKYDFIVPPQTGVVAYEGMGSTDKSLKIYDLSAHSPMAHEPDRFVTDVSEFVESHK